MLTREKLEERKIEIRERRRRDTKHYYQKLETAKKRGVPVAWGTGAAPQELLASMGVQCCIPENYVTICAAKQMAGPFCELAEQSGLSGDLCSYGRCIMGMMYAKEGPYGPMPEPDIIIIEPPICDAHAKMWEIPSHHYRVPTHRLDGPFRFQRTIQPHELEWRAAELKKLVRFVEENTSARFDLGQFKERMRLSAQAYSLWQKIQDYRKATPCPRAARDISGDLFYLVTMPGSQEAVDYLALVLEDVKERVEMGIGAGAEERFRILYDNIPVWYRLDLFDYLLEKGAVVVFEAYNYFSWGGAYFDGLHYDQERPFESLALRQLCALSSRSLRLNLERYARAVREWHCDGAMILVNRSCKMFSTGITDKAKLFREECGIPVALVEADMSDPRTLTEVKARAHVDEFVGFLASRKESR